MTLTDIAIIAIGVATILNAVNIMLLLKRVDTLEFGQAWFAMRTGLDEKIRQELKEFEDDLMGSHWNLGADSFIRLCLTCGL